MQEQTQKSIDNLKNIIDKYQDECKELAHRFQISNILFFLFIGLTIIIWIWSGLSYLSLLAIVCTLCLWFDGTILRNKIINIMVWIAVLSDLHGNLEQSAKKDALAP
jgi:hypothetical protein